MAQKDCPLNTSTEQSLPCKEGRCAWWDEDAQACAVLVLAKSAKKVTKNAR